MEREITFFRVLKNYIGVEAILYLNTSWLFDIFSLQGIPVSNVKLNKCLLITSDKGTVIMMINLYDTDESI